MSWLTDWRLALRVGLRQARRSWGRSLLVVLLVGIPVTVLTTVSTLAATRVVTPAEEVPALLGSAEARIVPGDTAPMLQGGPGRHQDVQASRRGDAGEPASPAAVAAATGVDLQDVTPVIGPAPVDVTGSGADERQVLHPDVGALFIDPHHPGAGPLVELRSGRLPTTSHEVLVTEQGVRRGLPESGPVTVTVPRHPAVQPSHRWYDGTGVNPWETEPWETTDLGTLTVVGVAASATDAALILPPSALGPAAPDRTLPAADTPWWPVTHYLLTPPEAVTEGQVEAANALGWVVQDRAGIEALPSSPLDELFGPDERPDAPTTALMAVGIALVLAQTALMVGPAFAIGYERQRHDLALLSSNGATRTQLRRYLLGQALVLGGLTAVVGVAVGPLLAWGALRWATARWVDLPAMPFDVPWVWLGLIALVAVVTVVAAALWPAQRVFREDAARAVRTGFADRPPSRRVPWVLVPVWLTAALLMLLAPWTGLPDTAAVLVVLGLLLVLLAGAVLLVPWCLHTTGRLADRLPLGPRLALRDIARHRARSAPTVGAVAGAVAVVVAASMLGGGYARSVADYGYDDPDAGSVQVDPGFDRVVAGETAATQEAIRRVFPEATPLWADTVVDDPAIARTTRALGGERTREWSYLATAPSTCSAADARTLWWRESTGDLLTDEVDLPDSCWMTGGVLVVPTGTEGHLGLSAEETEALRSGTVLVGKGSREDLSGEVRLLPSTFLDVTTAGATRREVRRLMEDPQHAPPLWTAPSAPLTTQLPQGDYAVLVPEAVLDGADAHPMSFTVVGEVSPVGSLRLLGDPNVAGAFYAFTQSEVTLMVTAGIVLLASVVLLLACIIGAALRQREAACEDAALAAVGASPSVRRTGAVWHALATGVLGAVLGALVGLVPGARLSRELTAAPWLGQEGTVVWPEPWVWLAVMLTVLLAALVAGVLVPRRPDTASRRRAD